MKSFAIPTSDHKGKFKVKITGNPRYICLTVALAGAVLFLNMISDVFVFKKLCAGEKNLPSQTEIKNISPKQARELMDKSKDVFVLDVRTKEEYDEVHLKEASLIPIQELEQNTGRIPKDKKVIIHCASGKRSARACEMLKDKGLKELYNLEGGILKWQAEGYPVVKP